MLGTSVLDALSSSPLVLARRSATLDRPRMIVVEPGGDRGCPVLLDGRRRRAGGLPRRAGARGSTTRLLLPGPRSRAGSARSRVEARRPSLGPGDGRQAAGDDAARFFLGRWDPDDADHETRLPGHRVLEPMGRPSGHADSWSREIWGGRCRRRGRSRSSAGGRTEGLPRPSCRSAPSPSGQALGGWRCSGPERLGLPRRQPRSWAISGIWSSGSLVRLLQ